MPRARPPLWSRLGSGSGPAAWPDEVPARPCTPPRATAGAEPGRAAGLHAGPAHSCVSSRVSGLQEASLWLQLLSRLWELLATWARGSERMRYLRAGEGPGCRCCPARGGQRVRTPGMRHGVLTRGVTKWGLHLHDVVGLQPRVGRGVDEDVGQRVLLVVHLVCRGDRAPAGGQRLAPAPLHSAQPEEPRLRSLPSLSGRPAHAP